MPRFDLTSAELHEYRPDVAEPADFDAFWASTLAEHLPADLAGRAADLGAGYGYLSRELLERCPKITALDLYEAEQRALALAELNLAPPPRPLPYPTRGAGGGCRLPCNRENAGKAARTRSLARRKAGRCCCRR